eukprot:1134116-Pelagomonas_calceolata.AAC.5
MLALKPRRRKCLVCRLQLLLLHALFESRGAGQASLLNKSHPACACCFCLRRSRLPTGISAQGIGLRTKADPEELKMGASAQPEGLTSRNLKQPPIAPNTYSLRSQSPSVPTSAPLSPQPPPPPQERVSNIHGPPSSSSTVSSNSGSGINGVHCGTNVPLTSKLARMFSGLSNSLSTRMGELTRAAVEGSSGRGGQKGLRGSAASTEGAEDPQKEGAMEEYQAEGLWVPAAGMQHVVPRRSFSCSTLPPLASKVGDALRMPQVR